MSNHLVFVFSFGICLRLKWFDYLFRPFTGKILLRITRAPGAWVDGQKAKSTGDFVRIVVDNEAVSRRFRPAFRSREFDDVELFRLREHHLRVEQKKTGDEDGMRYS